MNTLNEVKLIGRLGKEPELKYTQSQNSVAFLKLSLCTSKRVKKGNDYESQPVWHNIAIWGKSAENAARVLSKGDLVYVSGELSYSQWEKDGQRHEMTEVIVGEWKLMNSKNGNGQASSGEPCPF